MRAYSIRGLCCVAVLALTVLTATATEQHIYIEDFTTTVYKDPVNTTALWNTVDGRLELSPFQLTFVGSYDTPGGSADLMVAGDMAFVADAGSGLVIIDISNPASPSLLGSYDTPGNAQGLWIDGDWAYVCDDGPGLLIIDISNPAVPSLVGTYNTSGRAFAVEVAGAYAYIADAAEGLIVVDISNPAAPSLAGSYDTPGFARTIDVDGNYAYVADRGGGGLQIINITDPTTPTLAGSYNPGGDTWGVAVSGNVAYLGAASEGLVAVDVTDPTNPTLLNKIAAGSARQLDVAGDHVYVAGYGDVYVFDVTDPANPVLAHSYTTPGIASAVVVAGEHAYVADGNDGGMQVLHCADQVWPALVSTYNTSGVSMGVYVSGNHAFVADYNTGLKVIDISDPAAPTLTGSCNTPGYAVDVYISGNHAFVADYGPGLQVIDISNPASPTLAGSYDTPGSAQEVYVSGDYAFVANGTSGLHVINISNPAAPTFTGTYDTPGYAYGVYVSGDHAFIADYDLGLQVIDISNPASPTLAGTYNTPGYAIDVCVSGDYAFVTDYTSGLQVIDISNPASPTPTGSYDTPGVAWGIYVSGDYAFVADYTSGLQVIDISNPASPTLAGTYDTPGEAECVYISGDHAFVADNLSGLQVIQVFQREFDQDNNTGQSLTIDASNDTIVWARLTTSQTDSVTWELSADGGANWQGIVPDGAWNQPTVSGIDLLWRSTHTWAAPGVNPAVTQLQIEWLYEGAVIDSIIDIPNDQGRQVSIHWTRSGHDFIGDGTQVTEYAIYRRIDPLLSPPVEGRAKNDPEGLMFWPPGDWHYVTTVPARCEDTYATVVPTLADSTISEGMYYTTFFVSALTATPGVYFDSPPDSGYSVDNLAPTVPQGLGVAYNSNGGTDLAWEECPDADFQHFRIYRDESEDFTPGPGNLVHMTTGTEWRDEVAEGYKYYYKITAVDFSGNESDAASAGTVTGDDLPMVPKAFALHQNVPNPFNPTTVIQYEVPEAGGYVTLRIYDVTGRLVKTLVDGIEQSGRKSVLWDGRDARGARAASGVYFYRLEAPGYVMTRKMVLLK